MELSLESDAEALWQDTLDLLSAKNLPESTLAMLRGCTPKSMSDSVMTIETPMRLVLKTISKNTEIIEECLSQAAFEPMTLSVIFSPTAQTAAPRTPSTMSREEVDRWTAATTSPNNHWEGPTPKKIAEDTWDETGLDALREAAARRTTSPTRRPSKLPTA